MVEQPIAGKLVKPCDHYPFIDNSLLWNSTSDFYAPAQIDQGCIVFGLSVCLFVHFCPFLFVCINFYIGHIS